MYRFFYYDNIIPREDCDYFIQQYEHKEFNKGQVKSVVKGEYTGIEDQARDSDIYWIDPKSPMCRAIWGYMLEANNYLGVTLNQTHELAQLARYSKNQHYTLHIDTFYKKDHPIRNLSAILQLSKPEDYEGGQLELYNGDKEPELPPIQSQGSLVFFRSNEWHRVTPVLSGIRYSLVFWA